MQDIVAKVMISVESKLTMKTHVHMVNKSNYFEIFGFDILLDAKYKAWLIEVNSFPELGSSSSLDQQIKLNMIEDMLNMIGIVPFDTRRLKNQKNCTTNGMSQRKPLIQNHSKTKHMALNMKLDGKT